MTKKIIWALTIIIIIILGSAFFLFGGNAGPSTNTSEGDAPLPVPNQTVATTSSVEITASSTPAEKVFTVIGTSFAFNPNKIEVNKGDLVKITFKDSDGLHDLKIDGYNVATEKINSGQEQTITFTADKTGTFAFYCSVGTHREKGMKGTLIVK